MSNLTVCQSLSSSSSKILSHETTENESNKFSSRTFIGRIYSWKRRFERWTKTIGLVKSTLTTKKMATTKNWSCRNKLRKRNFIRVWFKRYSISLNEVELLKSKNRKRLSAIKWFSNRLFYQRKIDNGISLQFPCLNWTFEKDNDNWSMKPAVQQFFHRSKPRWTIDYRISIQFDRWSTKLFEKVRCSLRCNHKLVEVDRFGKEFDEGNTVRWWRKMVQVDLLRPVGVELETDRTRSNSTRESTNKSDELTFFLPINKTKINWIKWIWLEIFLSIINGN